MRLWKPRQGIALIVVLVVTVVFLILASVAATLGTSMQTFSIQAQRQALVLQAADAGLQVLVDQANRIVATAQPQRPRAKHWKRYLSFSLDFARQLLLDCVHQPAGSLRSAPASRVSHLVAELDDDLLPATATEVHFEHKVLDGGTAARLQFIQVEMQHNPA